jgi:hypothetical protein
MLSSPISLSTSPTSHSRANPETKYSIKYQIYYFQDANLRRIQVSLDKSKSLQYNLKKWVIRLKLVSPDATQDHICQYKLWKSLEDCTLRQLINKDFSQDDTLFVG